MKLLQSHFHDEIREAAFSEDGHYRYRLSITWDSTLPVLPSIGLNPSIAGADQDDNTIRKERHFAKSLGFGGLCKLNAFALVSTDYRVLFRSQDPVGPENTLEFLRLWADGPTVLACWGAHITERNWRHYYRGHDLAAAIPNLMCLRRTKSGHPEHPLYLPKDLKLTAFSYQEEQAKC